MKHASQKIIHDEHFALRSMLRSLTMMVDRGPAQDRDQFFDTLRAMLFYIDEFPERLHHPKESDLLFPRVARLAPQTMETIVRLEKDHARGESSVRELQHQLLAWELIGDTRRAAFEQAARSYVGFYLEHMQVEESFILPVAEQVLGEADWQEMDAAFAANQDPLVPGHPRDPVYDLLFTRIVTLAPAPIGLGHD
ncbi:MAG: hemerythrin domain-containing protein [Rhodoferax sp.]|nr:hemerythrin domain-containing protein [Rhodoferax sp.]